MCDDAIHHEHLKKLCLIEEILRHRTPIDLTVQISAAQPWFVDYHNRKHIFLWLPTSALSLSFEDYGTGTVQQQVWTNIGMPPGTRIFAPGNATTTPIMIRCTDEVIP